MSSSAAINWSAGNVQSTSVAAGTITFTTGSMINGAAYTLALTNATGGTYTLSGTDITTWKCNPACSSGQISVTAGYDAVLTIVKIGSTGYVSWSLF